MINETQILLQLMEIGGYNIFSDRWVEPRALWDQGRASPEEIRVGFLEEVTC